MQWYIAAATADRSNKCQWKVCFS